MKNMDKIRGCLIGGAAGDALGYAVEFLSAKYIFQKYGPAGITEYALVGGVAPISDDTQMTLFTAAGLLTAKTADPDDCVQAIAESYQDWLITQTQPYAVPPVTGHSRLMQVPALYCRRAPGNTCLGALASGVTGSVARPINHSKGCGGVMRVAPVGLAFDGQSALDPDAIDDLAAEAAAITHGHPLGYIPAAALAHMVYLAAGCGMPLAEAAADMRHAMARQYAGEKHLPAFLQLVDDAIRLAGSGLADLEAIGQLGEGWVGDEAFAIALYCALKYPCDFDRAIIAAVNHDGDSDSTGAIAGNLLGASLGLGGIPEKYLQKLELKEVILAVADALYAAKN